MPNSRVLVIDEESTFARFLQDGLEQRAITVACIYSPGDENGARAFAPNVIVADKKMLSHKTRACCAISAMLSANCRLF